MACYEDYIQFFLVCRHLRIPCAHTAIFSDIQPNRRYPPSAYIFYEAAHLEQLRLALCCNKTF